MHQINLFCKYDKVNHNTKKLKLVALKNNTMKKLLSLFMLSIFIISCSEKDPVVDETPSEPNGSETIDPSNFGTISSMPNQFFDKVNPDVGKWNLSAKNSSNSESNNQVVSSSIYQTQSFSSLNNSENAEYIEEQLLSITQQVNDLIDEELSVLNEIQTYLDEYINQFRSQSFDYDPTNYIKIKDTLFVTAEELHNNAISKRNEAVEISSEAIGEQAYLVANNFIEQISTKINDAVPTSLQTLSNFFSITYVLYNDFNVDFSTEVISEIEEFYSVVNKIAPFNEALYNILFDEVYENLYGSEWINEYGDILADFTDENYNTFLNLFPSKLDEINSKLELFEGYYNSALEQEQQFNNVVSELVYESSKNGAKMFLANYIPEIGGRYTEMNAWKLALLISYLDAQVQYILYIGELSKEYHSIFANQSGYNRLPCNLYERIIAIEPIEVEANTMYPDFDYLGISYENWPAYDEQFWKEYPFESTYSSLIDEMLMRINESGCDCFIDAGHPIEEIRTEYSVCE